MKQKIFLISAAILCFTFLSAHNLFIKLDTFFLKPESEVFVSLYNGTFSESEAVLARDRMIDVSVVLAGEAVAHPPKSDWFEKDNQTILKMKTGEPGTGLFGVSTSTRVGQFTPEGFIDNMRHEGLLHVLDERKRAGEEGLAVRKKYSKHVKAIFQVGDKLTDDFNTNLNYPIEFIPVTNPYALQVGDELTVLLLIDGKPAVGEMVYASFNDQYGHADDGTPIDVFQIRTDSKGEVSVNLSEAGHWYFRTVHLDKSTEEDADYISNSAALTFEVK